jgi:hypothetical protein
VKITKLSLVAIATLGMISSVSADVDLKVGGQGVVYYQTADNFGDADFFDHAKNSKANAGLQLNVSSDLGNGFGLGFQETFLGTLGLEKNVVGATMQNATDELNGAATTKLYLTKKISNTTLKIGRQELPKSLSPFAFSEGWNVFKNTFDAAVAINSDIPDTTLVGAYVSQANGHGDLSSFNDMAGGAATKGAYMLTVANESAKGVPVTASYYSLPQTDLSVLWLDVQAKQLGPVNLGLQGGMVMNDASGADDTTGLGVKVSGKAGPANLTLAYSTVDDGGAAIKNVGTGVKTPLYTQMVANQGHIAADNDTFMLKAVTPVGPGKAIAQYAMTSDNSNASNDYNELDLLYKFKALGTNMLVAYVMQDDDAHDDPNNIIRFWTRYNF